MSERANDFANLGHLTRAKCGERDELTHGNPTKKQLRTILNISYRLILVDFQGRFNHPKEKSWVSAAVCRGSPQGPKSGIARRLGRCLHRGDHVHNGFFAVFEEH